MIRQPCAKRKLFARKQSLESAIGQIRRTTLRTGDTLVLKTNLTLTQRQGDRFRLTWAERFPGIPVAVISGDWDLIVLRAKRMAGKVK